MMVIALCWIFHKNLDTSWNVVFYIDYFDNLFLRVLLFKEKFHNFEFANIDDLWFMEPKIIGSFGFPNIADFKL